MTMNHAHFEMLCALAASRQLTSAELAEFHEHSERCSSCRDRLAEMTQLGAWLFCAHAVSSRALGCQKTRYNASSREPTAKAFR